MENNTLAQILEKGGTISWRGKYLLEFIERWNINPDREWSGYEVNKSSIAGYHTLYKSMNITECIEYLNMIIDEDIRNEYITHYGEE
jgi:hypothetical protein